MINTVTLCCITPRSAVNSLWASTLFRIVAITLFLNTFVSAQNAPGPVKYYYQPQSTPSWSLPHFETPSWSPGGSKIALQAVNVDGVTQICIIDADGTDLRKITDTRSNNAQPCWSPVADNIAFVSDRDGRRQIYVMNSDGSGQMQLTHDEKDKGWVYYSPDGKMIACSQNERMLPSGWWVRSLNVMDAAGGNVRKLHTSERGGGFCSWSRDGKQLYFYEISPTDLNDIYRINVDGTGLANLTRNTEADSYSLDMSPDGQTMSFVHDADGIPGANYNWEIFTMNPDGSGRTRLTDSPLLDSGQKYSPDGSKFAFISGRTGYYEVYVMNSDGSEVKQLTHQPETELVTMIKANGLENAIERYHHLRKEEPGALLFSAYAIRLFIEEFLKKQKYEEAMKISTIFSDTYPNTAAAYDLLAEAYLGLAEQEQAEIAYRKSLELSHNNQKAIKAGHKELAILNYEKSLTLNPANTNARQMLKKMAASEGRPSDFDWNEWHPAWSPDGSKIAFSSWRDSNYDIYVMNSDGSAQRQLTADPADDMRPTWSPDGRKIIFNSNRNGHHDIYLMDPDGGKLSRLTDDPGNERRAVFSPDGSKIAFDSDREGNTEIYVMTADGSNQARITNSPDRDDYPDWSPDGSRIVFNSRRDGNGEIYVMNSDGSNPVRLTHNTQTDQAPRWSHDGRKIAFFSSRDDDPEIYVMNADGSEQQRLTVAREWDFMPVWSPDDSKIAFDSRRDGRRGIYVMNADGSHPIKLTNKLLSKFATIYRNRGFSEAMTYYHEMQQRKPDKPLFLESELAVLAFQESDAGNTNRALELFQLNLDAYPTSSDAYGHFLDASRQAGQPVPPDENEILEVFRQQSVDAGVESYRTVKASFPAWSIVTETGLNRLGYEFLNSQRIDDALAVFRLNVELNPRSFNVYDSLGEAYMKAGMRQKAIENYQKSLELNPDNTNATKMLEKLTN